MTRVNVYLVDGINGSAGLHQLLTCATPYDAVKSVKQALGTPRLCALMLGIFDYNSTRRRD